jgi:glycosyltransferase involved in cell wall biosynthesis
MTDVRPLRDRIKHYTTPGEYAETFRSNLRAAGTADEHPDVRALLAALADAVGIEYDLVALDFKRYLLYTDEYYPDLLEKGPLYLARGVAALAYLALRGVRGGGREPADVLLDEWFDAAQRAFYGRDLIDRLEDGRRIRILDVSDYLHVDPRDLAPMLRSVPRLWRLQLRARRALGLEVAHYVYTFLKDALSGKSLRRRFGARLVVSGNDTGLPLAKTKAAGLRVALIQNGVRGWVSDAVFCFADLYLALEAGVLLPIREQTGCRFARAEPIGSIMLSHYLAKRGKTPPEPEFDVVFVSSLETERPFDQMFKHYAMEFERATIDLVNELAKSTELSVAYYPRYANEVDALRRLGLHSDEVTYLEYREHGVYAALDAARVVLTSFSTVGLEAMAVGKPVGYVNLSGNKVLNPGMPEAGIEYTNGGGEAFVAFVRGLLEARDIDLSRYIVQAPDFSATAARLIAEELPPR